MAFITVRLDYGCAEERVLGKLGAGLGCVSANQGLNNGTLVSTVS